MMEFKSAPVQSFNGPRQHTTHPIVVGASVIAVKYAGGVMMMADTLASYGGLARFKDVNRVRKVNEQVMISAGGDYSDFQYIMDLLEEQTVENYSIDDGHDLDGGEIYSYLTRVMYQRRSKVNPLWNEVTVGGVKDGKSFLGLIDLYGTHYETDCVATGFGSYMATPLLRKHWKADMSEAEARKLCEDCMRVLFYRHCRTMNRFQIGMLTKDGVKVTEPFSLETKWDHSRFVNPLKA